MARIDAIVLGASNTIKTDGDVTVKVHTSGTTMSLANINTMDISAAELASLARAMESSAYGQYLFRVLDHES